MLQRASRNPLFQAAAEWTRAGLYVGNGDVVDAVYGAGGGQAIGLELLPVQGRSTA